MGSYINAKTLATENMVYSYKFIVDKAKASDKKYTPKRMIIVIVSTIAAFFMALVLLIVGDYFSQLFKD